MFTKRQRDVIAFVFEGLTSQEIADHFNVSKSNIENILANLYRKCNCRNRVQLVTFAIKNNLLTKNVK